MRLNLKSVEERVRPLAGKASYDREFIFDLLAAYGRTSSNITRLRHGSLNVAVDPANEVAQKGVVYFKHTNEDLYGVIDDLKRSPHVVRYSTRFVIVTEYDELLAIDTKTGETLATPIAEIDKHFAFILPWAGMEKAQYVGEKHADVKAAEKMAKRIAGAKQDSTYLMAPVEIVATYRTYNLKTHALEHLLHRVFSEVRLQIEQTGKDGRTYEPSEWYVVPLETISHAAELIASGEIVHNTYDKDTGRLVPRSAKGGA